MGFKRGRKIYHLVWPADNEQYGGLEVDMRGLSIDQLVRVMEITSDKDKEGLAERFDEMFTLFGSKLVGWNITDDDDVPVPATSEAVKEMAGDDPYWLFGIVLAWATAIGSVDTPLPEGSSSGENSQELSTLGLESQSKSLGS
jgi:hypothetical protein